MNMAQECGALMRCVWRWPLKWRHPEDGPVLTAWLCGISWNPGLSSHPENCASFVSLHLGQLIQRKPGRKLRASTERVDFEKLHLLTDFRPRVNQRSACPEAIPFVHGNVNRCWLVTGCTVLEACLWAQRLKVLLFALLLYVSTSLMPAQQPGQHSKALLWPQARG